jgi:2-polyprenyl-3-methyl-5-hydroxy-6-metoxy-1,4-benzoquinol methylase
MGEMGMPSPESCLCGAGLFRRVLRYEVPPNGEIPFDTSPEYLASYRRAYDRCGRCGHFLEAAWTDYGQVYAKDYVNATYGDSAGMRRAFDRVMGLPPERSDNVGRVERVLRFFGGRRGKVLDVGSGLCVFLARLSTAGWEGTALDLDCRQASHAEAVAGVRGLTGNLTEMGSFDRFDLISFNKVLEHVDDPIGLLARSRALLLPEGAAYVEVPDGEGAMGDPDPANREEFFIGHRHVFSAVSLSLLIARAGLGLVELERLREPSGKYTLRAFARVL